MVKGSWGNTHPATAKTENEIHGLDLTAMTLNLNLFIIIINVSCTLRNSFMK